MNKKSFWYPTLLALSTALISGTSNFLNKVGVTAVKDPIVYTTLKNSLVAIFLIGIIIVLKKWKEIIMLDKQQILKLIIIGIVGGSIPFALFFTGLTQTSALNASLIHKTLFIWVALLAIPFLKERIGLGAWFGVIVIFIANLFVGGFIGFKFNSGELMILIATLFWAVENIIAKKVLKDVSSLTVAGSRMILGSILLFFLVLWRSDMSVIYNLNAAQLGWTFLTSVTLLGYVLTWYEALKYARATYVATLLVPATLVTNILSAVFITHTMAWQQVVAGGLYVIGAGLIIFFMQKASLKNTGVIENVNIKM